MQAAACLARKDQPVRLPFFQDDAASKITVLPGQHASFKRKTGLNGTVFRRADGGKFFSAPRVFPETGRCVEGFDAKRQGFHIDQHRDITASVRIGFI